MIIRQTGKSVRLAFPDMGARGASRKLCAREGEGEGEGEGEKGDPGRCKEHEVWKMHRRLRNWPPPDEGRRRRGGVEV